MIRNGTAPSGILALALLGTPATAQWLDRLPREQLPQHETISRQVDAADLDGDQDVDLVFARFGAPFVYRNEGNGRFVADSIGVPAVGLEFEALRLVDVDGNGFPDLLGILQFGGLVLWTNQGGVFTDATSTHLPAVSLQGTGMVIVDFDADGDTDTDLLVVADWTKALLLNDGTGHFSNASGQLPPLNTYHRDASATDIDDDGDLDLLLARMVQTSNDSHTLLVNDGNGTFTDESALRMPPAGNVTQPGGFSLAAGDLDGDGDVDVVAGQGLSNIAVYINSDGYFTAAAALSLAGIENSPYGASPDFLRLADVDGDQDLDLVFIVSSHGRHLYLNDGGGNFTPAPTGHLPQARLAVYDQLFVDLDGDGDQDLVQTTPHVPITARPIESHSVLFNDGSGRFFDVGRNPLPSTVDETSSVLAVDLDRDALPDAVHAIEYGPASQPFGMIFVLRGNGDGTFLETQRVAFDGSLGAAHVMATADVDGDGWPDLYASLTGGTNLLFLNQGDGSLAPGGSLPLSATRASAAAFVDVDGDSDPDLVTARVGGSVYSPAAAQTEVWINDGAGHFADETAARMPANLDLSPVVLAFDLQGDGDLDLFIGNGNYSSSPTNRLLRNDGSGHFTDESQARLPTSTRPTHDAAAVDLDGNGALDLLVGSGYLLVYLDDGTGTFVDATAQWGDPFFDDCTTFEAADLDGDGRVDLLTTGNDPAVMRNLPSQRFAAVSGAIPPLQPSQLNYSHPAVADFDDDGDLDMLHATRFFCTLYWGLRHQVSVPLIPKVGVTVPLRAHVDPGHNVAARPAFFAASLETNRVAMPWGHLWLDPGTHIMIIGAVVPAPGGVVEVPLEVGPWPGLQGEEFTVQGFVLDPGGTTGSFTNALRTRIQ